MKEGQTEDNLLSLIQMMKPLLNLSSNKANLPKSESSSDLQLLRSREQKENIDKAKMINSIDHQISILTEQNENSLEKQSISKKTKNRDSIKFKNSFAPIAKKSPDENFKNITNSGYHNTNRIRDENDAELSTL